MRDKIRNVWRLALRLGETLADGYPGFALKTLLHWIVPGGYGYMRRVRRNARDVAWRESQGPTGGRYESYEQYLDHQASKYNKILREYGGFNNYKIALWRLDFFDRVVPFKEHLARGAAILCVGARQGTEVEVLRDLGFSSAVGCDLNPGPANPYVVVGDFMAHKYDDESFDGLYSNAADHAYDLHGFFREQARVLKRNGVAIFDLDCTPASDYEAQSWRDMDEPVMAAREIFPRVIYDVRIGKWRSLMVAKK